MSTPTNDRNAMPDVDHALETVPRTKYALQDVLRRKDQLQDRRDTAVRRVHDAGASLQVIADVRGVHRTYVQQIVKAD
jgi:hypothetical protein